MQSLGWDLDGEGNVILCPLTGVKVVQAHMTTIVARLEFLTRSAEGEISPGAVQLAIHPNEALRLAKLLRETAEEIFQQDRPEKSS